MANGNRSTVTVTLGLIEDYASIDALKRIIADAESRIVTEGITRTWVEIETERGYYGNVSVDVQIKGERFETDEEYALRMAELGRIRTAREESEIQLYERLKRKFEGNKTQ